MPRGAVPKSGNRQATLLDQNRLALKLHDLRID
jgi:hypothetical protein